MKPTGRRLFSSSFLRTQKRGKEVEEPSAAEDLPARHSCEGRNPVTLRCGYRDSFDRPCAAIPPACRLRGGRFDRLPPLESLFFCWPKRKVTQRKWPEEQGLAASCWDKPERLRMVVAEHPWEAPQRVLRSAAQRARIAEDLKRSLAAHRPLLLAPVFTSSPCTALLPLPLWERVGERGAGARENTTAASFGSGSWGPRMTAAGGGRKARRVAAWRRPVFRQDTDVLSKNPATRTRTFRAAPGRRVIRGAFLFGIATISVVTFSWASKRK